MSVLEGDNRRSKWVLKYFRSAVRMNSALLTLLLPSVSFAATEILSRDLSSWWEYCSGLAAEPRREIIIFDESVRTPARREQLLSQAPSTTTVITAEDICRSGATNIPDLFRTVPGLDFLRTTASDVNITARGLNSRLAHRMQVFVDGRSVNGDFFNLVFWHELPISLYEIDHIEIVRSPSSALYGTVAFSGIIHIFTKSPEQMKGTTITQTAGNAGLNKTDMIHAGVNGDFKYKVSFEHDRANDFPNPDIGRSDSELGRHDYRGNIFGEYRLNDNSSLSVAAGIDSFERDIVPGLGVDFGRFFARGGLGYIKLNYNLGDFKVQTVWDRLQFDISTKRMPAAVPVSLLADSVSVLADSFKVEAQHSIRWGDNLFTGGAGYRFSSFDAPLLTGDKRQQHFFDAFVQDEYSPMKDLTFTLGLRVDTHPEDGVHVSPRVSVVYTPWTNHTFRASISRANRNPSVIENFVHLAIQPVPVIVLGDRNLKSEEITSYELGYETLLSERLRGRLDLFYNRLDKMTLVPAPSGSLLRLSTAGGGSIYGGELSFEYILSNWLKGFINYSFQEREFSNRQLLGVAPKHKANFGFNLTPARDLTADVYINTVGRSDGPPAHVDPYTLVNLHLGYKFGLLGEKANIGFGVFNLFNDRHREVHGGDFIERRVGGSLQIKF